MSTPIAVVLPFRDAGTGRTAQLEEALKSWVEQTEGLSTLYVLYDEDDEEHKSGEPTEMAFRNDILWLSTPAGLTLMEKLNYHAMEIADKHEYVQFLAHDIVLRNEWESRFIDFLEDVPVGMAYGNDLVHGGNLATHPCIKSSMIKAVGFYGCPAVEHNFFDNYWMTVAQTFGACMYFSDVVMEHNHPIVGKAESDTISERIGKLLSSDQKKFVDYMGKNFANDVEKLKECYV